MGIVSTETPILLIITFYLFLFALIYKLFTSPKIDLVNIYLIVYLVSFEILARMSKATPYIPHEMGKYLLFFFFIFSILKYSIKFNIGTILSILLLPALFYDLSDQVQNIDIRFNFLGALNIGLAIWFFHRKKITNFQINDILFFILLPLISALLFTVLKTPDYDELTFGLSANFQTTGGFGSNQVSTAFGLGMFLVFYFWSNNQSVSGFKILDLFICCLFLFQGLLSFSRGGMIGGFLSILIYLFFLLRIPNQFSFFKRYKFYILTLIVLLPLIIVLTNNLTGGNLFLRYTGETEGTLIGTKEKDINNFTTNRYVLLTSDYDLFLQYGIFGVGASASQFLRKELTGVPPHIEASRLIAEHGIFGFISIFLFLVLFTRIYFKMKFNSLNSILFVLFFLGWFTSFHAATRTFITPLLMGLGASYIINGKSIISRK